MRRDHEPTEVCPGIFRFPVRTPTLPPATHTNVYVVAGERALLIEPASPHDDENERLIRFLAERRIRPMAVVPTHHHPDHVGGARFLTERLGAPLWAHAGTIARLEGQLSFARALEDGESLSLGGGLSLSLIFTPGHAPGHLCFLEPESGAMIAGDMVAGVGTILIEPEDGNMVQYLASLRRVANEAPSMLLPAHGPTLHDPATHLEGLLAHRLMRERRVLEALTVVGGPAAAADLVPICYDDVPEALFPLGALSVAAHLEKLVAEGRARRLPGPSPRWAVEKERKG